MAAEWRKVAGEYFAIGLAIQLGVRMGNDAAVPVQQECIAGTTEVQGIDGVGNGLEADVPAKDAQETASVADPGNG
ncbi:hypothetical protein FQZ97_721590 [compost metagenome]